MIYNYEYFYGNKIYNSSYQLGTYYDMRYMTYSTRCKFILGLTNYNDDDTIFERENDIKEGGKYYVHFVLDWQIQKRNSEQSKRENEILTNDPVGQACLEIAEHIQKEDPSDKVVDEFLLHTYPELDERELDVCRTIVWAIWDISIPYYHEVVVRIMKCEMKVKTFANIKEIEDTIQRLVHKGILSQRINYIGNHDKSGNVRWRYDEPHIVLSFTKDPSEVIRAIGEVFGQMITSFIGPRTHSD